MTMPASMLDVARSYQAAGRSVVPIAPGSKNPSFFNATTGEIEDLPWKKFQQRPADPGMLPVLFASTPLGIGIVCGPVSGVVRHGVQLALEVLDVDDPEILEAFIEDANWHGYSELLQRLLHQHTPGSAGHFAYLCSTWEGNIVLARRPGRDGDPIPTGKDAPPAFVTLIETRGVGGQAVVAPTPPGIHPEHPERGYELVRGSWTDLPVITPEERAALFTLARSFNTYVDTKQVRDPKGPQLPGAGGTRPGDLLNASATRAWWRDLLETHNWTLMLERGDIDYWRRPGKEEKAWSATYGKCGPYFYVFSSNAAPFEADHAYNPFSAYCLLDHGGDFKQAARALAQAQGHTPSQQSQEPARLIVGLGTPAQQVPSCPDIILNTELTRMVDETQAALQVLPHAPVLYQRARHLAVIARGVKPPKWLHRPHDMPVILDASAARLTELATQAAHYWKWDKRAKEFQLALPSKLIIETLCSRTEWPFPVLEGIIASPTLRPDGSVLDTPGYDADTGLYLDTNGTTFPPLPARPALDDARSAVGALREAIRDFPFAETHHFSATLVAMLSLVCRFTIMGTVPLFAIRANTRGSGKSLLADVISIIGTGSAAPRWPQVEKDEEERKRLLTVALAGYPCLHIDNVAKPLGSPALDLALTSSSFSDRLLGKNESRTAPLSMVWLASGNNMQFQGDTARRIVPIDLDPKMERPEERTGFVHDPLIPWLQHERPRLTIAALTIVKAYFEAGCPPQGITPMGSFEQWSDVIRQALVWAGEADPNEGRKDLEAESNPEYEQLATLLEAWAKCYPIAAGKARSEGKTLKEVLDDIAALKMMDKPHGIPGMPNTPNDYDALQDALGALDEHYDGKGLRSDRISYKLRDIQGQMIGTKRLVPMGKDRTNKTQWGIESL